MGYIQIANPTEKEIIFGGIKVPQRTSVLLNVSLLDKEARQEVRNKTLVVLSDKEVETKEAEQEAEQEAEAKEAEAKEVEAKEAEAKEAEAKEAEQEAKPKAKAKAKPKGGNSKNKG
jgi:uncharacterized membrane protein YukC